MKRIMLIDDDTDMMKITERWLARGGYEVCPASSGREALAFLNSGIPIELILLDYAMPEMDGPATLEAIRNLETGKDIPVLFRTGKDDGDAAAVMEKTGAQGIVSKAEGKPALMAAISRIL